MIFDKARKQFEALPKGGVCDTSTHIPPVMTEDGKIDLIKTLKVCGYNVREQVLVLQDNISNKYPSDLGISISVTDESNNTIYGSGQTSIDAVNDLIKKLSHTN